MFDKDDSHTGATDVHAGGPSVKQAWAAILDGAFEGVWDWDVAANALAASESLLATLGLPPDTAPMEMQAIKQRIHPDDLPIFQESLVRHLEEDRPFCCQFRLRSEDDQYLWFLGRGQAQHDSSGRAVRMSFFLADITECKCQELELKRTYDELRERNDARKAALSAFEARFRSLVDTAPELILQLSPEGEIQYINRTALGHRIEDVIGTSGYDYLVPEDRALMKEHMEKVLRTGEFSTFESIIEGADGSSVWYRLRLGPYTDGGHITGVTCIAADITEDRKLEKEVLEIAAREQRRIGQDLHDVTGQLLTGLRFLSQSLVEELSDNNSPQTELANKINEGLARAARQVRAISKGVIPVEVDTEGLMSALHSLAASTKKIYGIGCTFDCDESVPIEDNHTATHLYRIAQEAVTNAVKHGEPSHIGISLKADNGVTTLKILDDGAGIEDHYEGSGMGVRIMRYRAGLINWMFSIGRDDGGTFVACTLSKAQPEVT